MPSATSAVPSATSAVPAFPSAVSAFPSAVSSFNSAVPPSPSAAFERRLRAPPSSAAFKRRLPAPCPSAAVSSCRSSLAASSRQSRFPIRFGEAVDRSIVVRACCYEPTLATHPSLFFSSSPSASASPPTAAAACVPPPPPHPSHLRHQYLPRTANIEPQPHNNKLSTNIPQRTPSPLNLHFLLILHPPSPWRRLLPRLSRAPRQQLPQLPSLPVDRSS